MTIINNNVDRLAKLVDTLLDISRMEAGMTKIDITPISPIQLARSAISNLQPMAVDLNVKIELNAEDDLKPISMDGNKMIQVMTNLISNAIKFSPPESKVLVSVKAGDDRLGKGENAVLYSVKDEGIGIPETEQAKIFMKFYQAKQPTETARKGSGLGLSITQEIVKLHQGRIWVESQENHGSTFFVAIPSDLEERTKVREVRVG